MYRSTITGEEIEVPLNMRRLNAVLNNVDYDEVRRRRRMYCRLYYEARVVEEGPGVSFTHMLLLLAHHKLIDDNKALRQVLSVLTKTYSHLQSRVEEAHRRKITTDHVTELVNLDRVRSLLKMVYHRRNYLHYREQLEADRRVKSGVPAIVVEDLPNSPPADSHDIAGSTLNSPRESFESRWIQEYTGSVPGTPVTPTAAGHQRQISDLSMLSVDVTLGPASPNSPTSPTSPRSPYVNPRIRVKFYLTFILVPLHLESHLNQLLFPGDHQFGEVRYKFPFTHV